jgi:hypothetical protein
MSTMSWLAEIGAGWYLGVSFWRAGTQATSRRYAGLSGMALAAYGVLAGFVTEPAPGLPA